MLSLYTGGADSACACNANYSLGSEMFESNTSPLQNKELVIAFTVQENEKQITKRFISLTTII